MKKRSFLMSKKLLKNTTVLTVLFVSIALISSSSLSANLNNISDTKDSQFGTTERVTPIEVETSAGLAPNIANNNCNIQTNSVPLEDRMWGYIANSSIYDEGICYFYLDDPGTIEYLKDTESDNFLSGGTGGFDLIWLGCQYDDGALWEIDPDTGDMWSIGGGGTNLNGLAFDPLNNRMYGVGSVGLDDTMYEINPDTGEQTELFDLDYSGGLMIGMAFDADGVLYGWELVQDKLWIIDVDGESLEEVGPLGIDINYAQDGDFDLESDVLYLSAFTESPYYGSYLYICDIETGECTLIGQIENNSQITASIVTLGCPVYNDVGVEHILKPEGSGHAVPEIDMELLVKNHGYITETFDAQMQIYTYEDGPIILEEDFSGTFPPEGWSTDWWEQSNTDFACGEAPEACCNKYTQYNQGDYYDNFIATKSMNCSDIEAVELGFKLTIDTYYQQYCNFHIKYRKDSNSPWSDITPWDNPIPWDINCEPIWITIYGDPYLGEEFQVKWEYIGYYYYFNDIYLDNVKIQKLNSFVEYAEIVEDVELGPGEEEIVDFPTWTPSYWQDPDYENTWQEFPVKACTLLDGDDKPDNDCKEKIVNLYFPWLHDIEITSIDSPCEDGPGKTYPVEATIKNVGQYADCCIPIDITISEPVVLETLLIEDAWDTVPPAGWYDEHKDFSNNYGWNKSYTDNSGGSSPEAILRYYQALPDHVMYSYAIDTSEYSNCRLEFKSYINHYSGSGLYALEAGYSTDGETWYAIWHVEPDSSGSYDIKCSFEGGHETLYIGFWVTGDPYYFNYWYIDNIFVKVLDFVTEYSDSACQGDELEPGETRTFEFDDWTPDFLQYETSGSKDYIVHAEIEMEGDKNPGNDIKSEYFTLDYWHDPALDMVTSPSRGSRQELLWENGEPDGRNGLQGSIYQGHSNIIIDDFSFDDALCIATGGDFSFVWNSGSGTGNLETVRVYFFEDQGDCDPSLDAWAELEVTAFNEYLTGDVYFGRPEIVVYVEFDDVELEPGKWWVGFQPDGIGEDIAYLLTAEGYGCEVMADLPYWEYPRWTSSSDIWGEEYDLSWALYGYSTCWCTYHVYIQPGTESIDAVAINYGTFEELDLTCNAQIWEYITDPENGTLQYEDNITNIDLTEPLGGAVDLAFDDFTFAEEGRYNLFLEMPAPNDDHPNNNKIRWGIGVDATDPVSSHTLDPPEPDGENGWYVNDLEVTLQAEDPYVKDVSSGVKEIKYRVNGGPVNTITGPEGTFLLTQENDGDDVEVEYWAIDNVGNTEGAHTFTIDMDQTEPTITLTYVVNGGNQNDGWTLLFEAFATDETSGMDRVEFYLNDEWQETVMAPGPYQWSFKYHGGLNIVITAWGFDKAGNMASDDVIDPKKTTYNQNTQQQSQRSKSSYVIHKSQQKLFVIPGGVYR